MKLTRYKIFSFMLAAAFALTLAGCGGNGGGTAAVDPDPPVMMPEPDPGPTPEEIAQMIMDAQDAAAAAATAANDALTAAKAAVEEASAGQDADAVHYALATTELGKAKDAKVAADAAAAQGATTVDDAEMYQGQAEAAQEAAEAARDAAVMFANAVNDAFEIHNIGVAVGAAETSKDLAATELAVAEGRVVAIRADAEAARAAANKAMAARTDYETANEKATAAEAILTRVEAAIIVIRDAAAKAQTAYETAMSATMLADAEMARDDAAMYATRAEDYTRHRGTGVGVGIGQSSGVEAADGLRMDAETAAATHVLGLFMAANRADPEQGEDESDEDYATRVARLNGVAAAAALAANDEPEANGENPSNGTTQNNGADADVRASVTYGLDTPKTADEDEAKAATRMFSVNFDTPSVIVASADATGEEDATTTSMDLMSLGTNGEFKGVELARKLGDAPADAKTKHVHVYTDIGQTVEGETTTTETEETDTSRSPTTITDENFDDVEGLTSIADDPATNDVDESQANGADAFRGSFTTGTGDDAVTQTGKLQCRAGQTCSVSRSGGMVTSFSEYEFVPDDKQVTTMMMKADDDVDGDYLAFGVWLLMPDTGNMTDADGIEVGAFASGSMAYTVVATLTGTATYEGPAVGVKTVNDAVSHVDGTATLMANFGNTDNEIAAALANNPDADTADTADEDMGTISGSVAIGGHDIALGQATLTAGAFSSNATMGAFKPAADGSETGTYPHSGMWGGRFYGPATDADDEAIAPGSAAGTFGVTGTEGTGDAAVTTSIVGAFGATKQ